MSSYLSPVFLSYSMLLLNTAIYMALLGRISPFVAALVIFLVAILFANKYLIGPNKTKITRYDRPSERRFSIEYRLWGLNYLTKLAIVAGLYNLVMLYVRSGQISPLLVSAHYSYLRFAEDQGIGIDIRFMNVWLYVGIVCGSLLYIERATLGRTKNLWLLAPAAVAVVESFLLGTKSVVVLTAIYIFISYRIVSIYHSRSIGSWKVLRRGAFYFLLIITALVVVQSYRSSGNLSVQEILMLIITSYTSVPTFAFLEAAQDITAFIDVGASSISGIAVYFFDGLEKRNIHIYFNIGNTQLRTNVYTAYYYLLLDFGYLGFFTILCLIPLFINKVEQKISENKITLVGMYIPITTFLLFAFADPLFKYLTNIAVSLVFVFLFLFAKQTKQRKRHPRSTRRGLLVE